MSSVVRNRIRAMVPSGVIESAMAEKMVRSALMPRVCHGSDTSVLPENDEPPALAVASLRGSGEVEVVAGGRFELPT